MQIVRTLIWILIVAAIVIFSNFNWQPVEVTIWDDLIWETKLPAVVIIAFLLGLVPMWLYHRSVKWSLSRRIRSLENSIKSQALARRHDPAGTVADEVKAEKPADRLVDKPVEEPATAEDSLTTVKGVSGTKSA